MSRMLILAALGVAAAPMVFASSAPAQAEDRYGPPPTATPAAAAPGPVALLSWPGKPAAPAASGSELPASPPAQADVARVADAYAAPTFGHTYKLRGVIVAAPVAAAQVAAPAQSAPMPAPVFAPPAPPPGPPPMAAAAPVPPAPPPPPMAAAATPSRVSDASGVSHSAQAPRFYSVARQYGVTPDPDPLPAQFFADNSAGDMAAPPPPLDPRPVPGTQAATSSANSADNRARQTAIATADAGADGPPGAPTVN